MKLSHFIFTLLVFTSLKSFAQLGGRNSFQFVNLPGNAHVAGIGGVNISTWDQDINMVWQNPALLRDTMTGYVSVGYIPFYADVKGGSMSYAHKFRSIGTIAAGIQYISYGTMTERDETGNELGTFHPQDFAVMLSKSHSIGYFTVGGTFKYVVSTIAPPYSAHGIMVDAGGVFRHPVRDFTIGLAVKNAGFAFVKYNKEAPTLAPLDVQLGTSYKLEHVPLRFSLTAHHLHKPGEIYVDTSFNKKYDLDGNVIPKEKKLSDQILRHFVIGVEFLLSRNLHARAGYNFQRRREMRLENKGGGAGFSWGFMFRIKSFEFDFSRAYYHLAGGKNWITVTINTNTFLRKKS